MDELVTALATRLPAWADADILPTREVLAVVAEHRCLGAGFPVELGGTGGDLWEAVAVHEHLASLGMPALTTAVLSHVEVATRMVVELASPTTARAWVPRALAGEVVLGYAATEAGAGSDLAATTTLARRRGDGWVIDGAKRFITNGSQADALCILARTSERAITSHTLFLVPMDVPGVTVAPLTTLGNRGTLAEVRFEGVEVDDDACLGLEGQGLMLQVPRLAHERAFVAVALAALAARHVGRAGELIADVVEARVLAHAAVAALVEGRDARVASAIAKLAAARAYRRVTTEGLGAHEYYDALAFAFAGGTDNMLLEAIAR